MTKKRKNKYKSKPIDVQPIKKHDGDKMDGEKEGNTVKMYLAYLWTPFTYLWPPKLLDAIANTIFRKNNGRKSLIQQGRLKANNTLTDLNKAILQTKNEQSDNELLRTKDEPSALKTKHEQSDNELSRTKEELSAWKTKHEQSGNDLSRTKDELSAWKTKHEQSDNELSRTKDDMSAWKTKYEQSDNELSRTKDELSAWNIKHEQLDNELSRTKDKLSAWKTKHEQSENELSRTNKELSDERNKNESLSDELSRTKKRLSNTNDDFAKVKGTSKEQEQKIKTLEGSNSELLNTISRLTEEKQGLESEKQDALRRLSELVSVKLRDNNPNIVDLNDQCRPTKVAEMFSELYDNEWTSAFDDLEGPFTEEHTIVVLLDTVMIAYSFCQGRVEEPWQVLSDWFLDENLPGFQQTAKWLKDSRKTKIQTKVVHIEKDFSGEIACACDNVDLRKLLSGSSMNTYFKKCIELCLLMVTTDPPIVLECPGWKATRIRQKEDDEVNTEKEAQDSQMNDMAVQQTANLDELSHGHEVSDDSKREKVLTDLHAELQRDENKISNEDAIPADKDAVRPVTEEINKPVEGELGSNEYEKVATDEASRVAVARPDDFQEMQQKDENENPEGDTYPIDTDTKKSVEKEIHKQVQDDFTELDKHKQDEDGNLVDNAIDETNYTREHKHTHENENEHVQQDETTDDIVGEMIKKDFNQEAQNGSQMPGKDDVTERVEGLHQSGQNGAIEVNKDDIDVGNESSFSLTTENKGTEEQERNAELEDSNAITDVAEECSDLEQDGCKGVAESTASDGNLTLRKDENSNPNAYVPGQTDEMNEVIADKTHALASQQEDRQPVGKHETPSDENSGIVTDRMHETQEETKQETTEERRNFDKDLFKEYTSRGKYLDYIVWPAMYLHKNGPLLSKGIAQGTKVQYRQQDEAVWTWRKLKKT